MSQPYGITRFNAIVRVLLKFHKDRISLLASTVLPIIVALVGILVPTPASASPASPRQKIVGIVLDSVTGDRLQYVNVQCKRPKVGTTTDKNGVFTLHVPIGAKLTATSLGYGAKTLKAFSVGDTLVFNLSHTTTDLNEIVIKPKKQKYSKKNNPAVELMKRVRADKDKVNPVANSPLYSYEQYDKMMLGINNYNGYLPGDDGKVKGKFKAIAELVDTGVWTGKRVLDLSMKEKYSAHIHENGDGGREIIIGKRTNGVDKNLDEGYTRVALEDAMREVNIYNNDIAIMRNRFVSPLASIGADYYKYTIVDTVQIGSDRCVEISFVPRNAESMGFNGKLYVPADDSVKWVRRAFMRLPKAANVNYVDNLTISQTFFKDSLGNVHKAIDDMVAEMSLVGSLGEMFLSRQTRYRNQSYERREDLADFYGKTGNIFVIDATDRQPGEFWQQARMLPLSHAESILATDSSPFRSSPFIYWTTKAVELVVKGYVQTGRNSKFDFGPIDTFISNNGLEGWRFSVGGMTTANLSKHVFGKGFVAYGIGDHRWKYMAELAYSFSPKKYHSHEFPVNGFRLSYSYDVNTLGQNYLTGSGRNLLNSFKRIKGELSTYQRLGLLEYEIEWRNHLSLKAELQYQRQESSRYVSFVRGDGAWVNAYTQNSLKLGVRYAPNEKFMQTYNTRQKVNNDAWIFNLSHTFGPKHIAGSEFTLNLTEASVQKRIWFSAFGFTDIIFKAAKLWNQVQFPALLWQNANIGYTVQSETYCLLNPMEFAMDQYMSLDLTYNMNGLLFNRIPLLKKLGWREVIGFRGFAGSLTKKNNPEYNENLFRFPDPATRVMGSTPYMELSVGIANIFTILRLDYVWRLTYRDAPGAPNSGLRFALQFAF